MNIRGLVVVGAVTLGFAIAAYRAIGELNAISAVNAAVGSLALLGAAARALGRLGQAGQPALRAPTLRALGAAAGICALALALATGAERSGIRFDWTFEGRFELAPATRDALEALPEELEATLYFTVGDPRIRNTRLLLGEMARGHRMSVRERELDRFPEDEDRYGIASSNSVVLRVGDRWGLVDRPTEGALFEALSRLGNPLREVVYMSVGAGEGDLDRTDPTGYSGLRAALETEGYAPRPLPLAVVREIPRDASAIIVLAPQRRLQPYALDALRRYLEEGGRMIAFLDPMRESGIEVLLEDFGIRPEDGLLIDPASGPIEGDPPGLNPIAWNYGEHPVTRGLDAGRMTFFRHSRSFSLRKVERRDRLETLVYASGDSWLLEPPDPSLLGPSLRPPPGVRTAYHPLVVSAEFERGGAKGRIVALGNADIAANRYLRALYNLDLVLNAVHWTTSREPAITLRPKSGGRQLVQFPVPLQTSLQALYGAGLLVPELTLLIGAFMWLRQRSA